jgi:uncharacterized membrane protein
MPDFKPLANFPMTTTYQWTPVIAAHAALAGAALVVGGTVLARRKGTTSPRVRGWTWVVLRASVASISFAIRFNGFSWIHGLSVYTLLALVFGVAHARRRNIRAHRSTMISIFVGALVITGLFTLLPQRLIGQAVWGLLG